jgi:hypothetical protein
MPPVDTRYQTSNVSTTDKAALTPQNSGKVGGFPIWGAGLLGLGAIVGLWLAFWRK